MILWTIQPGEVWDLIQQTGVYRCNPVLSSMPEPEFAEKYQWLINQMIRRIGPPPEGVSYPVWAWHTQNGKRKKPDLRSERWGNGPGGENYVCIELEVPDDQVLLSDFNDWSLILCNGLLADSEAEADRLDAYYETLAPDAQISFRDRNWEKAFDTAPFNNGWTIRGECIQATFWELRKEMIRDVRFFVTGKKKTGYGMTGDPNVFAIRWIFLTDSRDTELYLYLNGENILAFERSGRELTTRWNLDELTAWLRAFLDICRRIPTPPRQLENTRRRRTILHGVLKQMTRTRWRLTTVSFTNGTSVTVGIQLPPAQSSLMFFSSLQGIRLKSPGITGTWMRASTSPA